MTIKRKKTSVVSKKEEEQKRKKLIIIFLFILFLFLFKILNVYDFIFDIPSKPEVIDTNTKEESEWHSNKTIKIEKDAKARKGIKYYLYCINQDKTTRNCRWKKTYTKNIEVSKSGIHYVYFKGVNEDGIIGKPSDPTVIKIDNEAPIILDLMSKATTSTIKVKIKAEDLESGIDKYYYKIDEGDFIESNKNTYIFKDLLENHLYYITIRVVDKLGNAKEITFPVRTMSKESNKNPSNDKDKEDNNNEGDHNGEDNDEGNNNGGNNNGGDNNEGNNNGGDNNEGNNNGGNNNGGNNNGGNNNDTPVKEIPQLSLSEVPKSFVYGDEYKLPTSYKFGKSGGTVKCTIANKEYKDTSTIPIGKHNIVCVAKSNTGISVKEEKEVTVTIKNKEEEIWAGWITMNLYYPEKSTNWKWRLGKEDEVRSDKESGWKDYTGPITIRVSDIENIYIKYTLENGEDVVVAPNGRLAVDIEPNSYHVIKGNTTLVRIYYSEKADKKQYRINYGEWKDYTGAFEVSNDTIVEARIIKTQNIYDGDELIDIRKQTNYDSVYIATSIITNPNPSNPSDPIGGSEEKIEYGPNYQETPSYSISGPDIHVEPKDELVEQVKVHLTTEKRAKKIYYRLSVNDAWKEYNEPFIVDKNLTVYAKYITEDGETSQISIELITNIKRGRLPNVSIIVQYPSKEKVNVIISANDYEKLEYSLDGKIYHEYKNTLTITKNCTIYARAINSYGMEKISQNITFFEEPPIRENLNVSIFTNPDKDNIKGIIDKTTVSIHYDAKAEDRYYRIGLGEWKKYEGPFELNQNATIYAYATSETGYGMAEKQVEFLTKGISNPSIIPDTVLPTPSINVSINYDKNATIKKYRINNGEWINYEEPFVIDKNCTISAYNENALGYQAESEYEITNITEIPRYTEVVNRDGYWIFKLNYPSSSNSDSREYKWLVEGSWKKYDDHGILLIKEKYKDQLINKENSSVTVEDENGTLITFSDHYYIIEDSLEEMMGNLFMRWDYNSVEKPGIEIKPSEPSRFVNATIHYDSHFKIKEYKIIDPDGVESSWLPYTGKVKITKNNTIIYARGKIDHNSRELISSQIVTNIDSNAPKVDIRADLETPTHKLDIQIIGTDDQKVKMVGYARGEQDASYFEDYGIMLENNSTFTVSENGKYTIYVEDSVGNTNTKVIEITNIVEKSPNIDIEVLTKKYGTEAEIKIDYGNYTNIQYKIGTNGVYTAYNGKFTIQSNEVLNLANDDGTITVYARGLNQAGKMEEVSRIVYILDLDAPTPPIINSLSEYPILTEYGVKADRTITIQYDSRDDIENYYSLDNGNTWKLYTGVFETDAPIIQAKSVKKESALTTTTKTTIQTPTNTIGVKAYDEDESTYEDISNHVEKYIELSKKIEEQKIAITFYTGNHMITITYYDKNKNIVGTDTITSGNVITKTNLIPKNARYVGFSGGYFHLHEINISTSPEMNVNQTYPVLTEYGVKSGYSKVNIQYFQTAVKKLYSLDNGNTWQKYSDELELPLGTVVQAKSIDKNEQESTISTYNSTLREDAIGVKAYDEVNTTYENLSNYSEKYIEISNQLWNQSLEMTFNTGNHNANILFYDENKKEISRQSASCGSITTQRFLIPSGTKYIMFHSGYFVLYELSPYIIPSIKEMNATYPILTENGVENGYSQVFITYPETSVKKLYSIDNGETWKDYTGSIKVPGGAILKAKGVNQHGNDSAISEYTSTLPEDALGIEAYDNNEETGFYIQAINASGGYASKSIRLLVSEEMRGKSIKLIAQIHNAHISFYDENDQQLDSRGYGWRQSINEVLTIPENTSYIAFDRFSDSNSYTNVSEIKIYDIPRMKIEKKYPILTSGGVKQGYSEVVIDYFQTAVEKLYSIDEGKTWNNYTGKLELSLETSLKAKSVNQHGNDSDVREYTSVLPEDALGIEAYDNNEETGFYTQAINASGGYASKSIKLLVSEEMRGKNIKLIAQIHNAHISFYDENNQQLDSKGYGWHQSINEVLAIPENTSYIAFDHFSASNSYTNVFEMVSIDGESNSNLLRKKKSDVLSKVASPIIQVEKEDIWTPEKNITITYAGENYINEYSIDSVNWILYDGPIRITDPGTIYARSKKDDITLSTSSYNIIKVDNNEPKVSLDYLPYAIRIGSLYSLPSYQSFDDNISGGETICYANNVVVNSTEDLGVGTYQIKCIATTGAGLQSIIEKRLQVIDILEDSDHAQPEIEEVPNDNTPIGENEEEDEGLVANIETTVPRRNPKAANNTEETQE